MHSYKLNIANIIEKSFPLQCTQLNSGSDKSCSNGDVQDTTCGKTGYWNSLIALISLIVKLLLYILAIFCAIFFLSVLISGSAHLLESQHPQCLEVWHHLWVLISRLWRMTPEPKWKCITGEVGSEGAPSPVRWLCLGIFMRIKKKHSYASTQG